MRRPSFGPTVLIVGLAVLLCIFSVAFAKENKQAERQTITPSNAGATAMGTQNIPATPKAGSTSPTNPKTENTTSATVPSGSSSSPNSVPNCPMVKSDQILKNYEQQVKDQKDALDDKLSIILPVSVKTDYIQSYNQKVSDLYEKSAAEAKAANCSFPVSAAPVVTTEYLP